MTVQTTETHRGPLRLLIVDDHEVVRQGLVALLGRREGFQVVAEAGSVAESIEQARKFEPDVVVMDVRLPDGSGIEACREIRAELPAVFKRYQNYWGAKSIREEGIAHNSRRHF